MKNVRSPGGGGDFFDSHCMCNELRVITGSSRGEESDDCLSQLSVPSNHARVRRVRSALLLSVRILFEHATHIMLSFYSPKVVWLFVCWLVTPVICDNWRCSAL